jgi:hypothetical protein
MSRVFASLAEVWRPFCLHCGIVLLSAWFADSLPAHCPAGFVNHTLTTPLPAVAFIKWDAHWYTYIAAYGYDGKSVVFFPVLVVLIRAVAALGLDYGTAGLLVCNFFALLSFAAMQAAFSLDFPRQTVCRALYAYSVMPTAVFLNSIYTEPLFLTFALTCIYFARRGNWWMAGVCAALATLTRNLGVCLVVFLAYEYHVRRQSHSSQDRTLLALCFAPAALAGFMAYSAIAFGDSLAFVHSQQAWGRTFGWPGDNFLRNLGHMTALVPNTQAGITLDTFLVLTGFISLSAATISRGAMPISYLIVGWLWFLIPMFSTSSFLPLYSMSRFLLVVFPLYIVFAWIPRAMFACLMLVNALLFSLCTILFINWYWVG